jgi:hypothetical protein
MSFLIADEIFNLKQKFSKKKMRIDYTERRNFEEQWLRYAQCLKEWQYNGHYHIAAYLEMRKQISWQRMETNYHKQTTAQHMRRPKY